MRKHRWIIVLVLLVIVGGGFITWNVISEKVPNTSMPVSIDSLLDQGSGNTATGDETGVSIVPYANDEQQYVGGGEYTGFSTAALQNALNKNERVIIIFERTGDPTSEALRQDVETHASRVPANTLLLFANVDTETSLDKKFSVEGPNTIIYLSAQGLEIRRSGNGIVSLQQVVNGIDNLLTH